MNKIKVFKIYRKTEEDITRDINEWIEKEKAEILQISSTTDYDYFIVTLLYRVKNEMDQLLS